MEKKTKKRMGIIYCATNKVNGKMYIGQTIKGLKKRRKEHIAKAHKDGSCAFHRAIQKYGEDSFSWKILEQNIPIEQLNDLEMVYIDLVESYLTGYNMTHGGETSFGYVCSEETKKKISIANSGENNYWFGRKHSPEFCKRISEVHTGKIVSEETRKKLSDANKGENSAWWGKEHTEETKEKIRQSRLGKKASEETKRRIGKASKGRKHSEESKKKMSEARTGNKNHFYGKHHSEETLKKARIPVNQFDLYGRLIKQWDSANSASLELGIAGGDICSVCRGNNGRKTAGGFMWAYDGDPVPVYKSPKNIKCVSQYEMDGTFIASYSNIAKASIATGVPKESIFDVCRMGHTKSACGFIWRYGDNTYCIEEKRYIKSYKLSVNQYTKDNIFICKYNSLREATRKTGIARCSISNVCKGKAENAGGFKWEYARK